MKYPTLKEAFLSDSPKKEEEPSMLCGAKVHNEHCGCEPEPGVSDNLSKMVPGLGRVGAPGSPGLTSNFGIGELADEEDIILYDTDLGHREEEDDMSPLYRESVDVESSNKDTKTLIDDKKEKDTKELAGHGPLDTTKWMDKKDKKNPVSTKKTTGTSDKKSEKWDDFGQHDDPKNKNLKEAPRHGLKVPGGGPEFEEDPFSEEEFDPSIEDMSKLDFPFEADFESEDDPREEEYIQHLAKQRDYDDAASRVSDFNRFVDPDELSW